MTLYRPTMLQISVIERMNLANPLLFGLTTRNETMRSILNSSSNIRKGVFAGQKKKTKQRDRPSVEKISDRSSSPRKRVRFQPANRYREIEHVYDLGAIDTLWYTPEDFQTFADGASKDLEERRIFRRQSSSTSLVSNSDDDSYSYCGEASNSYEDVDTQRQKVIFDAVWSVMIEQACQDDDGIVETNPGAIAAAYAPHCKQSREEALLIGMQDARWVLQEQYREEQSSSRTTKLRYSSCRRSSLARKDYKNQRERYLRAKLPRVPSSKRSKSTTRSRVMRQQHHRGNGMPSIASSSRVVSRVQ